MKDQPPWAQLEAKITKKNKMEENKKMVEKTKIGHVEVKPGTMHYVDKTGDVWEFEPQRRGKKKKE